MTASPDHLVIAPILLPLVVGAALLLYKERGRATKALISFLSTLALIVVAILLMARAGDPSWPGVYLLGNWSPTFGIVLVADRVSTLMLLVTAILGAAGVCFSVARWHNAGPYFHSLTQFLLVGVNGAFLTGDLFNLFVFFEVMLAASYGLLLHGPNVARVRTGLHYIAINLVASAMFLVGVALIYGVTGTLNMADLAVRMPGVAPDDRVLLQVGAAILGAAFLVKAGMWPMSFWLPSAYGAAAAPVAAMFAIMSKVGIYVIWRLWHLLFGEAAGPSAQFGQEWLLYGGMATIVFGSIGVLASQAMARLAAFSVIVSSGTLLAVIGLGYAPASAGALYYLVVSTFSAAALFMLIELVERGRSAGADVLAVTLEAFGDAEEDAEIEESSEVRVPLPATLALLGGGFVACALLLAGLPPFPGFLAKVAILSSVFNPGGLGAGGGSDVVVEPVVWAVAGLLLASGLAALIAMTRAGVNSFWVGLEEMRPRVALVEIAPVLVLLALCLGLTVFGGPAMRYFDAAAAELHDPARYIANVANAAPYGGGGGR